MVDVTVRSNGIIVSVWLIIFKAGNLFNLTDLGDLPDLQQGGVGALNPPNMNMRVASSPTYSAYSPAYSPDMAYSPADNMAGGPVPNGTSYQVLIDNIINK